MRDEFLSEEDLDLAHLSLEELCAWWDAWLHLAQATNDADIGVYNHGVFMLIEEPGRERGAVPPWPMPAAAGSTSPS